MKIKVGVFFGGASVEHEVSVISALQAIHALDNEKYEAVPIYITKDLKWFTGSALLEIDEYKDLPGLLGKSEEITLYSTNNKVYLNRVNKGFFQKKEITEIDVAFPIVHGTFGEDGTLQGYFELLNIPYVGCDVSSSALGMDKILMKQVLKSSSIPVVDFVWFYSKQWVEEEEKLVSQIEEQLGYPVIVKPANLGSSVGISRATSRGELEDAVAQAMGYSNKVLIEKMVNDLKEVNCSVLGDYEEAHPSITEEVFKTEDILSYADKYQNNSSKGMSGTNRLIPADVSDEIANKIQELAVNTFRSLGCSGVSRIDFLIDQASNEVFVNEINTIPGSLSFYLWEPVGKSFTQLTSDLIDLALKRYREQKEIVFTYDSNLFSLHGGSKGKLGTKR